MATLSDKEIIDAMEEQVSPSNTRIARKRRNKRAAAREAIRRENQATVLDVPVTEITQPAPEVVHSAPVTEIPITVEISRPVPKPPEETPVNTEPPVTPEPAAEIPAEEIKPEVTEPAKAGWPDDRHPLSSFQTESLWDVLKAAPGALFGNQTTGVQFNDMPMLLDPKANIILRQAKLTGLFLAIQNSVRVDIEAEFSFEVNTLRFSGVTSDVSIVFKSHFDEDNTAPEGNRFLNVLIYGTIPDGLVSDINGDPSNDAAMIEQLKQDGFLAYHGVSLDEFLRKLGVVYAARMNALINGVFGIEPVQKSETAE